MAKVLVHPKRERQQLSQCLSCLVWPWTISWLSGWPSTFKKKPWKLFFDDPSSWLLIISNNHMWCSCLIFICDSHRYIYIYSIYPIYICTFDAFRCSESWRGSHSALDHPPLRFQLSLGPADLVLLTARCTQESLEMLANLGTVS